MFEAELGGWTNLVQGFAGSVLAVTLTWWLATRSDRRAVYVRRAQATDALRREVMLVESLAGTLDKGSSKDVDSLEKALDRVAECFDERRYEFSPRVEEASMEYLLASGVWVGVVHSVRELRAPGGVPAKSAGRGAALEESAEDVRGRCSEKLRSALHRDLRRGYPWTATEAAGLGLRSGAAAVREGVTSTSEGVVIASESVAAVGSELGTAWVDLARTIGDLFRAIADVCREIIQFVVSLIGRRSSGRRD